MTDFPTRSRSYSASFNVNNDLVAKLEALNSFELRVYAVLRSLQISMIVSLTLNEVIALFGLVLAFMAKNLVEIVPFAAAAIMLNLLSIPRLQATADRATRFKHLVRE